MHDNVTYIMSMLMVSWSMITIGFHAKISSQLKTMDQLKLNLKIGDKTAFDLETIFLLLPLLQLAPIFQYELCTIPPSLIGQYGCLRKGNRYVLANRLVLKHVSAPAPYIVIVDMQYMLYHIVWPHGGDASDLSENIKRRLSCYWYRAGSSLRSDS